MSDPKRLHPISAVVNVLKQLKELIIPLLAFVVFGSNEGNFQLLIPAFGLVFIFISGILSWLRFSYRLEEGELRIEYGIFVRKKRYIPFERIQSLDLSEGILQRPFGLVRVKVETAGASKGEAEAVLTAIPKDEARLIQETLFLAKNEVNEADSEWVDEKIREELIYQITPKELLLLASTSGGVGVVLSGVFAFIFQFDEMIPFEKLFQGFEDVISNGVIFISVIVFIGFLLAWMIALIGTMIKYAKFTVIQSGKDLVITRGLLEKRQMTIPLKRIQAIRITENVIRQPLGLATVYLESAGGSAVDQESAKVMLLPIMKKKQIGSLLSPYLKDYMLEPAIRKVPMRALKRYILRGLFYSLPIVAVPVVFFRPWGYWALLLFAVSVWWSYLKFKDAGWDIQASQLSLRYRNGSKTTIMMKRNRIQSLKMKETYFQRNKKLRTVSAVVMSGTGGAGGTVVDLEQQDVENIYRWYSYTK